MKIILVRHGETKENAMGLTQGWLNSQLNETGLKQAGKLSEELAKEKITFAYSSDLDRARKTAEEILKFHNCKLILSKQLREQNKGIYEGGPVGTSQKDIDKLGILWCEFKPEGGESYSEVLERVSKFYEETKSEHNEDETILIVTHGGPLSVLCAYINNGKLNNKREYLHKNAALTILQIKQRESRFLKLNSTEHL